MGTTAGLADRSARDEVQTLSREALECLQLEKLNQLLATILPTNRFYQEKLGACSGLTALSQLQDLPFTTKSVSNSLTAALFSCGILFV